MVKNAIKNSSMGGPITNELKCAKDTKIKTQYSERSFDTNDMQYIEILTRKEQNSSAYSILWFFVSTSDYHKIKNIIYPNDNLVDQCRNNWKACLDSPNSFTKLIDMHYAEV